MSSYEKMAKKGQERKQRMRKAITVITARDPVTWIRGTCGLGKCVDSVSLRGNTNRLC